MFVSAHGLYRLSFGVGKLHFPRLLYGIHCDHVHRHCSGGATQNGAKVTESTLSEGKREARTDKHGENRHQVCITRISNHLGRHHMEYSNILGKIS
jgi:hypothetical protein